MPGLVLYNRRSITIAKHCYGIIHGLVMARWALGSDDCILPASLLCLAHSAWLLVLLPLTLTTLTTQHTTDPPSQVSAARINNNNLICLSVTAAVPLRVRAGRPLRRVQRVRGARGADAV